MANADLYDSASYRVPQRVLDGVRQALQQHPGALGSERAQTLLRDPALSYSAAKAIKADLDAPGAARQPAYALAGGAGMLAWLNQALTQDRQQVTRSKTTRSNAGLTNQFRQAYERRETGAVTSLARRADDNPTGGVRRQTLTETPAPDMLDSPATSPATSPDAQRLAQALVGVYPTLTFTKDPASGALCIRCGELELRVTASSAELDEGWLQQTARKVALTGALLGAATQMPHGHGGTAAQQQHNQDVEHFEQAAKYAKRRETEAVTTRMASSTTDHRPAQYQG